MTHKVGVAKFKFNCYFCGEPAEIPLKQYKNKQLRLGCSGPYCSKSCAQKARWGNYFDSFDTDSEGSETCL